MSDAVKLIVQRLGRKATRQRLQAAASGQGYTEAEFEVALRFLQETVLGRADDGCGTKTTEPPTAHGRKPGQRPFDPEAAGKRAVQQLKHAEGGAWTGAELQERFGLTAAVLHRRRKEYRIVHWRDAKHDFHYPRWQFTPAGALLPGLQEVLQTLASDDEWRLMSYFLGRRQQLDDRRPLDLLRAGEQERVLAHAKLHAQENTW